MNVAQLTYLCDKFGDPGLEAEDKWQSIKSISIEGQAKPIYVSPLIDESRVTYIDNELGQGFIITDFNENNLVLSAISSNVTFIPLELICALSFRTTASQLVEWDWAQYDETDPLYLHLRQVAGVSELSSTEIKIS